MNAAVITVAGNAVDTPTIRFTSTGTPVANLRIASTERRQQDGHWTDGPTTYLTVVVWQKMAENLAESVRKGDRVLVHGRLVQNDYQTADGDKRTSYEITADEIALSLRHSPAASNRAAGQQPDDSSTTSGGTDPR